MWMGDQELTNRLIDTAEWVIFEGISLPLALPQETIRYKLSLQRAKDQIDLAYLRKHHPQFFQQNNESITPSSEDGVINIVYNLRNLTTCDITAFYRSECSSLILSISI